MKTFLKRISIYGGIFLLLILGSIGLNRVIITRFDLLALNPRINKLIIGASRTECALDDAILKGSYNISGSGEPLLFTNVKLRAYKDRNSQIDTVILSLDNRTLNYTKGLNWYGAASLKIRIPKLSHFFTFEEWKRIMSVNLSSTLRSVSISPKYSVKLLKAMLSSSDGEVSDIKMGGYLPLSHVVEKEVIDDFMKNDSIRNYRLSDFEIENLNEIIRYCKSNNVELIFINPPLHPTMYHSKEYQEGKNVFDEYFDKNFSNYTYLDFSDNFLGDSCYADLIHLNNKGAQLFSKKLNHYFKYKVNPNFD